MNALFFILLSFSLSQPAWANLTCNDVSISSETENLAQMGIAIAQGEFEQTNFGYRIQKECLVPGNGKFLEILQGAITKGKSCLRDLANAGGTGARRNLDALNSLTSQNNIQILCNETSYSWSGTEAYATNSDTPSINSTLIHPGISLNPSNLQKFATGSPQEINDLQGTIFHEQLHNLGQVHSRDVEYSYTCEACCFTGANISSAAKESACKICSSSYEGVTDPDYLFDITMFADEFGFRYFARESSLIYLRTHPGDLTGINYLAKNMSDVLDPVGIVLAQRVASSYELEGLSALLNRGAQIYQQDQGLVPYMPSATVIAEAYYQYFMKNDAEAGLRSIQTQLPILESFLNKVPANNSERIIQQNNKHHLRKILIEIGLESQASREIKGSARELMTQLGLR